MLDRLFLLVRLISLPDRDWQLGLRLELFAAELPFWWRDAVTLLPREPVPWHTDLELVISAECLLERTELLCLINLLAPLEAATVDREEEVELLVPFSISPVLDRLLSLWPFDNLILGADVSRAVAAREPKGPSNSRPHEDLSLGGI